jgi:hypothetical protein
MYPIQSLRNLDSLIEDPAAGNLNRITTAILHTAAYADVFDYPLMASEIHRYLVGVRLPLAMVEQVLQETWFLSPGGGYYALQGREVLIQTRSRREQAARQLWPDAIRYGRVLGRLPFVRMVAVTGALAMNNVDEGADVDFLIVTEGGRLWFARALVLLIGRLARRRHGISLCPNYLISLHSLDFPDQTLYAAHELAQMVPLSGFEVYDRIRRQNDWVARFLPNASGPPAIPGEGLAESRQLRTSPVLETILSAKVFTFLERWEMERKIRKLQAEQCNSPEAAFSADFCKGHGQGHQAETEAALQERLVRLQREYLE